MLIIDAQCALLLVESMRIDPLCLGIDLIQTTKIPINEQTNSVLIESLFCVKIF